MPEPQTVTFTFAGQRCTAPRGATIASALWSQHVRALRDSSRRAEPRGLFCGMGICFDCLVRVQGRLVRACMTQVEDGLVVERGGDGPA
jgi:predicted molibdopterin-dependent oxidoreductase YjgC